MPCRFYGFCKLVVFSLVSQGFYDRDFSTAGNDDVHNQGRFLTKRILNLKQFAAECSTSKIKRYYLYGNKHFRVGKLDNCHHDLFLCGTTHSKLLPHQFEC